MDILMETAFVTFTAFCYVITFVVVMGLIEDFIKKDRSGPKKGSESTDQKPDFLPDEAPE